MRRRHWQRPTGGAEVGGRDNVHDAWPAPDDAGVNRADAGMGVRAPHEYDIEHPWQRQVRDVAAASGQEPMVLESTKTFPDELHLRTHRDTGDAQDRLLDVSMRARLRTARFMLP